jgi:hypothetical protein
MDGEASNMGACNTREEERSLHMDREPEAEDLTGGGGLEVKTTSGEGAPAITATEQCLSVNSNI